MPQPLEDVQIKVNPLYWSAITAAVAKMNAI